MGAGGAPGGNGAPGGLGGPGGGGGGGPPIPKINNNKYNRKFLNLRLKNL